MFNIISFNLFYNWGWRKLTSDDFSIITHRLIDNFYQKNAIFDKN
jgi:hypothetical protein